MEWVKSLGIQHSTKMKRKSFSMFAFRFNSTPEIKLRTQFDFLSFIRTEHPSLPFACASLTSWGAFVSPESVSRTRCFWKSASLIVFKNVPRISHAEISVTQSLLRDNSEITSSAKVLIFWFCREWRKFMNMHLFKKNYTKKIMLSYILIFTSKIDVEQPKKNIKIPDALKFHIRI